MDAVFQAILAAHPEAVLLLKELPYTASVGKQVLQRMSRTMSASEIARVVMLPPLSAEDSLGVQALIDVTLDSFPFGGHTTTMDALAAHSPVVTLPHTLAAGRGSLAFLTALQLPHLIASDVAHYVTIALSLGRNDTYRLQQRDAVRQRLRLLTEDTTSIDAWAQMLETRVRGDPLEFQALLAPLSS